MSEIEDRAARIGHPVAAADASGMTGTYRYALTGSLQTWTIPTSWRGRFVTVTICSSDDAQVAFSAGVAPVLVKDQLSSFGTGHVGAAKTVFSRTSLDRRVPGNATHVGVIATSTSGGFIEFECSEQPN